MRGQAIQWGCGAGSRPGLPQGKQRGGPSGTHRQGVGQWAGVSSLRYFTAGEQLELSEDQLREDPFSGVLQYSSDLLIYYIK